jgi:hypothetical protein
MATKRLSRAEADGRRVARYCARQPRSMLDIRYMLSDDVLVPLSRSKRAVDWCKAQRLTSLNPFLCVHRGRSYLYGFRSDLIPDVSEFLHHELRYLGTRLGHGEAVIEHCLVTTASLSAAVGPSERVMLNRWRRILSGQLAAAEQVSAELDELLTAV